MSTLKVSTLQNLSGTEVYTCKAWVNFNGTGTVAIRASGNVSSITDGGTGDYTVNFTTAMPDANYAVNVTTDNDSGGGNTAGIYISAPTTSSTRVGTKTAGASLIDKSFVFVSIFR